MCHILTDPSDTVQRMAYKLLRETAVKYTEYLVLEAGVDSDVEASKELATPAERKHSTWVIFVEG